MATTAADPLARLGTITQLATAVMHDPRLALEWLLTPNLATENIAPVDYLQKPEGYEKVENLLHRIQHGMLA